jgi:hypothetical protein
MAESGDAREIVMGIAEPGEGGTCGLDNKAARAVVHYGKNRGLSTANTIMIEPDHYEVVRQ